MVGHGAHSVAGGARNAPPFIHISMNSRTAGVLRGRRFAWSCGPGVARRARALRSGTGAGAVPVPDPDARRSPPRDRSPPRPAAAGYDRDLQRSDATSGRSSRPHRRVLTGKPVGGGDPDHNRRRSLAPGTHLRRPHPTSPHLDLAVNGVSLSCVTVASGTEHHSAPAGDCGPDARSTRALGR